MILPCYVQNFTTIWQLDNTLQANEISQDLSLRCVSDRNRILHHPLPPGSLLTMSYNWGVIDMNDVSPCPAVDTRQTYFVGDQPLMGKIWISRVLERTLWDLVYSINVHEPVQEMGSHFCRITNTLLRGYDHVWCVEWATYAPEYKHYITHLDIAISCTQIMNPLTSWCATAFPSNAQSKHGNVFYILQMNMLSSFFPKKITCYYQSIFKSFYLRNGPRIMNTDCVFNGLLRVNLMHILRGYFAGVVVLLTELTTCKHSQ